MWGAETELCGQHWTARRPGTASLLGGIGCIDVTPAMSTLTKALFRHETVVSPCMVAAKPKKFSTSCWAISWRMAQTSSRSLRACVELPWGGPQLAEQVHWRRFYRAPFPNWSLAGASNFTSLKLELKLRYMKLSFVPSHNTHACIFASISPKSPFRNVSMKSHTGYMQIEFPNTFFGAKFNLIPPDHSP